MPPKPGAVMSLLLALSAGIDSVSIAIGRLVSWLILVSILVCAGNSLVLYFFQVGSNAWLELQWLAYGVAFLLAAPYTLQRGGHVRIDIVSDHLPRALRQWIDLAGHVLMLVPFCLLMLWESGGWALESIRSRQDFLNFGGLPLWPIKSAIVAGFALLLAQAISEIVKRIAAMRGLGPDDAAQPGLAAGEERA